MKKTLFPILIASALIFVCSNQLNAATAITNLATTSTTTSAINPTHETPLTATPCTPGGCTCEIASSSVSIGIADIHKEADKYIFKFKLNSLDYHYLTTGTIFSSDGSNVTLPKELGLKIRIVDCPSFLELKGKEINIVNDVATDESGYFSLGYVFAGSN